MTTLNAHSYLKLAQLLDQGLLDSREIERLTISHPDLTDSDGYRIQDEGIHLRTERGERIIGFKMGLTSQAKREQMNLHSPIYGVLTDRMKVEEAQVFSLKGTIHPKIEPEIAFLIQKDISKPITLEEAANACSGVCAALEILDSRFLNFKYFSLPDVIADNASSSYFVLSSTIKKINEIDLSNLTMSLSLNGTVHQTANSSTISGHPLNSLVQLCDLLSSHGRTLPAGSVVLAGASMPAVALEPNIEVRLHVQSLGSVSVRVR